MNKKPILIGVTVLAMVALGVSLYRFLEENGRGGKPRAPKISLIPQTPPPPPPPPKEEKKPDPPKEQKEMKADQVAPPKAQQAAPPSQELKMEGAAGDGPSAFSQGQVTSEDLSKIGGPGGGGASAPVVNASETIVFQSFTRAAALDVKRFLSRHKDVRELAYKVRLKLWVQRDGRISRYEVEGSTGEASIDEALSEALKGMGALRDRPPENMPQPIHIRVQVGR